ncbi:ABC transporter ATP-binding protein [Ornithinibacillus bavariensis]|uniref:Daunorubicin resistance protein DrrA family ABC transporter ATP-binding protein n=1 Tax=Ornithinibacillus bavariensis TaxID=545502 RepID=A0A919X955_9BACI|nr:ABC transporter ATP-binding protein [Ornithinibacillus bavariensis]GIO27329.1 daunorubicin resistance protein DrrA family ABC transporter ATP-binding protein [Ornithinibacillus bavariensis]
MENVIEVKDLTRVYKLKEGNKLALDHISFDVKRGEVFGLLGPNGAGKTTTIKILTTLLLPTEGDVKVLGYDVVSESQKIRNQINFVYGGERGVYGRLTGKEYLYYFCTLYKVKRKEQPALIDKLLDLVSLKEAENQKIHTFSKGMIQRLHIARCLINEPKILFLDEPTIGLDPVGARLLRDLVRELSEQGITVILTTHYMQEADDLCDRIAFIRDGKISIIGEPSHIKESCNHLNLYEAILSTEHLEKLKADQTFKNVEEEVLKGSFVHIKFEMKISSEDEATSYLEQFGQVLKLSKREISLEDAYIYLMEDVG